MIGYLVNPIKKTASKKTAIIHLAPSCNPGKKNLTRKNMW